MKTLVAPMNGFLHGGGATKAFFGVPMPTVHRSPRPFRHHLVWALFDVTLDLTLVGLALVWVLHHLSPHP